MPCETRRWDSPGGITYVKIKIRGFLQLISLEDYLQSTQLKHSMTPGEPTRAASRMKAMTSDARELAPVYVDDAQNMVLVVSTTFCQTSNPTMGATPGSIRRESGDHT